MVMCLACKEESTPSTGVLRSVAERDTFVLFYKECVNFSGTLLCFDRVEDGRCLLEECPYACDFVEQYMKGKVRLLWIKGKDSIAIALSVPSCFRAFPPFCDPKDPRVYCNVIDTMGYRFHLLSLAPYPDTSNYPIALHRYYIQLTIQQP